jgi:hypothetical protein
MLAVAAADEQRESCPATSRCVNVTISYPFWLRETAAQRPCGLSDFEVTCFNTIPVLRTSLGSGFAIIGISYPERGLRVVDQGKLDLLRASNSCQARPIMNTSVKLGIPFRIDPANLNLTLYNCTMTSPAAVAERRHRGLLPTKMKCGNGSEVLVRAGGRYYDETSDYAVEGCHAAVVPVMGSSSEANASHYEQLISDGFLLTWEPPPPLARKFDQLLFWYAQCITTAYYTPRNHHLHSWDNAETKDTANKRFLHNFSLLLPVILSSGGATKQFMGGPNYRAQINATLNHIL